MESTVIPLELVFEHRNYLALFGPVLVLVVGLKAIYERAETRRVLVAGIASLLALLALNTTSRAFTWSDADTFAAAEYRGNDRSPRAISVLFLRALEHQDKLAMAHYLRSLQQLVPEQTWPWLSELLLYCNSGQDASALTARIQDLAAMTLVRPADIVRVQQLSRSVLEDQSCPEVSPASLRAIVAAFADNPRVHQVHTRIGAMQLYARILGAQKDFDAASRVLREAITLSLDVSPVWLNATVQTVADVAAHKRSYDESMDYLQQVTAGFEEQLLANNVEVSLYVPGAKAGDGDAP
jgi:hypothetical protein